MEMTPKRIKEIRDEIKTWPHEGDEYCEGTCKHWMVEEVLTEVEKLQILITAYHETSLQKETENLKLRQELIMLANSLDMANVNYRHLLNAYIEIDKANQS